MVTAVGSGAHTFEAIEDWAKLPPGWGAPMAALTVDSQDRVYGFNRGEHPVIVFDKNGNYLYSWGDGMFAFPHAIRADSQDTTSGSSTGTAAKSSNSRRGASCC